MSKFVAISKEHHGTKRWLRLQNYSFAVKAMAVPIVGAEIAKVVLSMPITFVRQDGQFQLSAMLSVSSGTNMFVAPDGRWLGPYIPSSLRSYPFRLVTPEGAEQSILCIEEDRVISADNPLPGEAFFAADGTISPPIQQVLDFLTALEQNRLVTNLAVSSLEQAGVIKPWPITLKSEQGDKTLDGLHRIDEVALNALPSEEFIKLRATGALPIAYAQLLSMGQLGVFEQLARMQGQLAPRPLTALPDSLDKLFDRTDNLEIRFD
jgi:hypothetical protein